MGNEFGRQDTSFNKLIFFAAGSTAGHWRGRPNRSFEEETSVRVGLDIGSTTIKCVVLDEHEVLVYSTYERHYSHILEKAQELLRRVDEQYLHGEKALLSISGSAGMGLADSCSIPLCRKYSLPGWRSNASSRGRIVSLSWAARTPSDFPYRGNRGADERQLCRRHRCFHRPDGHLAQDAARR